MNRAFEVHFVSCSRKPVYAPAERLAPNVWFHCFARSQDRLAPDRMDQGCIRATRRFLQQLRPDIVHGQGTERDGAPLVRPYLDFPAWLAIHGNMNALGKLHRARAGSFLWLAARLENFTLRRTCGVICISNYVKNLVGKYGVPTWLVPNAIQKMFFDFPKESNRALGKTAAHQRRSDQ